jgi:hypothetical protein
MISAHPELTGRSQQQYFPPNNFPVPARMICCQLTFSHPELCFLERHLISVHLMTHTHDVLPLRGSAADRHWQDYNQVAVSGTSWVAFSILCALSSKTE